MPPRILLILTENHTMRPEPDVADLVAFAVEAEHAGLDGVMVSEHVVLGPSADAAGRPATPRDYALPGNQDPATPWPSPLVPLRDSRCHQAIRLVAGALISRARHPLVLAKDLATLGPAERRQAGRPADRELASRRIRRASILFERRGDILASNSRSGPAPGGVARSFDGTYFRFGEVWQCGLSPRRKAGRRCGSAGRRCTWRVVERITRYGSGFNPLGQPDDAGMARLEEEALDLGRGARPRSSTWAALAAGLPGRPGGRSDEAFAAVPALMARGFTTICVKPSQFIDDATEMASF
jgi:hypothetical protein